MINKAKAKCSNGHTVVFGPCNTETTTYFFFKSVCNSEDHEVVSRDQIQCQRCKTIHLARACPQCDDHIPVSKFNQKTLMDRIKR